MAEVFEAELAGELGFTRKIAIKRVLADAARDPITAQRFVDEARIASRLHHANIVAVLDVGLLDGLPFQVLELIDGINAQQLMQRAGGALTADVALIIAAEVARALAHAHAATDAGGVSLGIVHRDVKPSNVLLSWGGDVKLSDFGIALARDRESKTEAGTIAGTSGFMAPEQRQRSTLDGRTDVFALGLTLHALLTGASPLQELEAEIAVYEGNSVQIDAAIAPEIARVLGGALAVDRLARPSAAVLAEQLAALVAARVPRDHRSVLQDYLGPHADVPARRAGVLDHLFGVELVASAQPASELARYELKRESDDLATVRSAARDEPRLPQVRAPDEPSAPIRRRGRGLVLAVAVAAAGVALVGGVVWKLTQQAEPPLRPAPPPVIALVAPPDATVAVPRDAAEIAVVVDAAPPAPVPMPHPTHRHADAGVAAVAPTAPPPPPAATGTGYVQIAGEDLLRGKILVDGALVGYAPAKLALARGHHTVRVVKADGTATAARAIEVTDLDTLATPLRPDL